MKNLKYFPFERNRYFYGKLLTVDDFETEQKYMNDKRRMINRFLMGTGVVCGMNVVEADTKSISVEMGLALDFAGREIVIDTPIIKKLELIDGFQAIEDMQLEHSGNANEILYLCVEYAEAEKDPVHNIAGSSASLQQVEYNKYREGYHLFLTEKGPDEKRFGTLSSYQNIQTLYWNNGIKITQICPQYTTTQQPLEVLVVVENLGQSQPVKFSYQLDLTYLQYQGTNHIPVEFDESKLEKNSRYELRFPVKAMPVQDTKGILSVKENSAKLWIGSTQVDALISGENQTNIIAGSVKQEIMRHYYNSAMEEIVENNDQQSIYLARILLIRNGKRYSISEVENMAVQQPILNLPLASVLNQITTRELEQLQANKKEMPTVMDAPQMEKHKQTLQMNTGTVLIDLGLGGRKGERFFSNDISHGLGLGMVTILLSIESVTEPGKEVYTGSPEIFDQENGQFGAELASKLNMAEGTFRVGLRLTATSPQRYVKVHWTALRDMAELLEETEKTSLFIKPNMAEVQTLETICFEAVCPKMQDSRIRWSVNHPAGGVIDKNGMYTAPNTAGVYEITAQSMANPKMTASAFVVVREQLQRN